MGLSLCYLILLFKFINAYHHEIVPVGEQLIVADRDLVPDDDLNVHVAVAELPLISALPLTYDQEESEILYPLLADSAFAVLPSYENVAVTLVVYNYFPRGS